MGVGEKSGSGGQYLRWATRDDVISAIFQAIMDKSLEGAVDDVAPQVVTTLYFPRSLEKVAGRLMITPFPAFAAQLTLGEMVEGC